MGFLSFVFLVIAARVYIKYSEFRIVFLDLPQPRRSGAIDSKVVSEKSCSRTDLRSFSTISSIRQPSETLPKKRKPTP
ncbi:hypothetical protein L596_017409 [Steinernema carpocapsae]|uniref:Uncharacterized protein n=1 Tax=Steinernema carpocapsae TaxID=34508 RepID=A0A4U5N1Y4_STECR|nr:hypothetical protein L596_017409 [Steinernema carpocapsae]